MTKRALIIGISYSNTKLYLPGVKNDVISMSNLLQLWGFNSVNIAILAEKHISPTSYNINTYLNRFCQSLEEGDQAVIYYSGHGTKTYNKNRLQESCLVPLDNERAGPITSETIRYYLNKISENVNVLCLLDCCNSGTICNLKYHMFDTSYRRDITVKLRKYSMNDWILRQNFLINEKSLCSKSAEMETDANIVSISGCWDTQSSYDLGRNGALTLSLLQTISKNDLGTLTFDKMLMELRGRLINLRVKQTPQIMIGKTLNSEINLKSFLNL